MRQLMRSVMNPVRRATDAGSAQFAQWFMQSTHRFTITGLSRSGKSMLFTSLMTILKYRSEQHYQCLPLLRYLPMDLVEKLWIEPLGDLPEFPVDAHLQALENGQWPPATESVAGFQLIVRLRQTHQVKKYLLPFTDVVFEFIDYPGEWLTDLPMLDKTYTQWSDSAWAQQMNEPQSQFAGTWHKWVNAFDFEQPPTPDNIAGLVNAYREYLLTAKAAGISMLQPGSFLIPGSGFDWQEFGFTPLPSRISSDQSSPWTQRFAHHFGLFQTQWLQTLKQNTFRETDKQIILVDLFEGLNHSKSHLYQLRETLSNLSHTFVYGNPGWLQRHLLKQRKIAKVAFVATKSDLLPASEHDNLLALLKDVTRGATAQLNDDVQFEHFLVSAIQATDAGSTAQALRYVNQQGRYIEATFEPLPDSLKAMPADEHYPALPAGVPNDYLARMLNGNGLDRLLQYLLEE
ncbi:YcjX family protein [Alteromonas gilva]|uniref:YcjX family protein n=1 Tax=Alteromonas gilva TaxID=2987522 RepID=A0ABT5L6G8_9ALTE|nr:YcjX family protein [Alteromonas gilva]MDC8831966.1 YcjX family protein [Alteromonas gilva]